MLVLDVGECGCGVSVDVGVRCGVSVGVGVRCGVSVGVRCGVSVGVRCVCECVWVWVQRYNMSAPARLQEQLEALENDMAKHFAQNSAGEATYI